MWLMFRTIFEFELELEARSAGLLGRGEDYFRGRCIQ